MQSLTSIRRRGKRQRKEHIGIVALAEQKIYTVNELAAHLHLHRDTIISIFEKERDVIISGTEKTHPPRCRKCKGERWNLEARDGKQVRVCASCGQVGFPVGRRRRIFRIPQAVVDRVLTRLEKK